MKPKVHTEIHLQISHFVVWPFLKVIGHALCLWSNQTIVK